jgi:hypothetical protein
MSEDELLDDGIGIHIYPDEMLPLLKILNRSLLEPDKFALTKKEVDALYEFKDGFVDVALQYGV